MAKTKQLKKGKRLSTSIQSIRSDKPGNEVFGILGEIRKLYKQDNSPVVGNFDQHLETIDLIDTNTGEITTYWCDGGLRGQLKISKCEPGKIYFITHTGAATFTNEENKVCNIQTYEIFEAVEE